jgi:hypothetical protein
MRPPNTRYCNALASAIPVVWKRNSGKAMLVSTAVAAAHRGRRSSRSTPGRISSASPIWNTSNATITNVGGAMLDNRSPGTPTIDPG